MKAFLPSLGLGSNRLRLMIIVGALAASAVHGQTALSFDFETPFTPGSIMGQQGWSAGSTGNTLLVDPSDHTTVTSEAVTTDQAFSGTQSWRYDHGITSTYSFGPGTPFTPSLGASLDVGYQFSGTIYFKAVSLGDGSYMELDTGNPAQNDRAEIIAYLNNNEGDLNVTLATINSSHDAFIEVTVGSNLDGGWHRLDYSVTRLGTALNSVTAMIDGSDLMSATVEGALGFYRSPENESTDPYEESTSLKFAGSVVGAGFYFDNISYAISAAPVPEPATYGALLGGVVLLGVIVRRRKTAA